ncbi:hypothetical protein OESDEN_25176 [Oesophagostomum dentatum]|uniref:Uncharacterized protein n=1 Tax=Oesophagostomum dentatum TaxID=61180 RepID=A0A0B1RQ92_OESDE|nr:hypothetical protein OESDEN_25176 [Oesophagostomum dentatum]
MALPLDLPLESNEFNFSEKSFLPFTESNQIFVIHRSSDKIDDGGTTSASHTCLINAYGRLLFVEENKVVCLPKLVNESSLKSGHSIELSCADILPSDDEGVLAILATFWVELNEHFCPCRHFGALFRISTTLHVELTCKVVAAAPVAHCSLINNVRNLSNQLYWVVYEAGKALSVYKVQEGSLRVEKVEHTLSVFPELALDGFPGAVIRSSLASSENLRWSALGFDTGHVFLSVYAIDTHIVYRYAKLM